MYYSLLTLNIFTFTLLQTVIQRASNATDRQENLSNVSDRDNAVKLAVNKFASGQTASTVTLSD